MDLSKRVEEIAVELTSVRSVVGTPGEIEVSEKVYEILSKFPYFKENSQNLKYIEVPNDPKRRKSVFAHLEGNSNKTIVFVGHIDTVGTSDYGDLEEYATNPYKLTELFNKLDNVSPEVKRDIESGEYLFGRGIFDMKTGDAVIIALLEELSKNPKEFPGNIIYLAVIDEEGSSNGMLSCIEPLIKVRDEKKLDYQCLLDTDYITHEYEEDDNKYIYLGTVGKIMPSFYIVGKETHVGESFKGLDPNLIASKIIEEIDLNPKYSDTCDGESTLPPITLKLRDLKKEYSVQTAKVTNLYFNYATHKSTPDEVMEKMMKVANDSFNEVLTTLNTRYEEYTKLVGRPFKKMPFESRVISFEELIAEVENENPKFKNDLEAFIKEINLKHKDLDERDKSLMVVEYVHNSWSFKEPVIIVYFAPPYYPHIILDEETQKGRKLLAAAKEAVSNNKSDYKVVYKKFFPYISDLSYGSAPKNPEILKSYKNNTPGYGEIYSLPLEQMSNLDLQVLNIGSFGKDAHKWTERVHKDYSFRLLPKLVMDTITGILK